MRKRKRRMLASYMSNDDQPSASGPSTVSPASIKNQSKTLWMSVKNVMNDKTFKRSIRVGSEILDALTKYKQKPSFVSGVWCAFEVVKAVTDDNEAWSYDYFNMNEWSSIFSQYFYESVYGVINTFPYYVISTPDDDRKIQVFDMDGIEIGVYFNPTNNSVIGLYTKHEDKESACKKIREMLWNKFKDNNVILTTKKIAGYESNMITFAIDNSLPPIQSSEAQKHAEYLKRCINANVSRSLLFIGSPGTGKSTLVQTIIHNMNLRSFRIRVEELPSFDNDMVFDAVETFTPDVIVIDDFDRTTEQVGMLQILERLKKKVKVIMLTVNNKEQLDEAILRPGRIDEFVYVEKLSDNAVKAILGQEHIDVFDNVKNWPVAFINEYINRRKFMSADEAMLAMKELSQRVRTIRAKRFKKAGDAFEEEVLGTLKDGDGDVDYEMPDENKDLM